MAMQAGFFLAFLVLQNLLGTLVSLYVEIPSGSPSITSVLASSPALATHIVIAVLLLLASTGLVVTSRRLRDGRVRAGAWIAFLGTAIAFYAGASFTFYAQSAALSLLMDGGFLLAAIGGILVLYSAGRRIGAAIPLPEPASPAIPL